MAAEEEVTAQVTATLRSSPGTGWARFLNPQVQGRVSAGSAWTIKGRALEGRKELDGRVELLHNAQGRETKSWNIVLGSWAAHRGAAAGGGGGGGGKPGYWGDRDLRARPGERRGRVKGGRGGRGQGGEQRGRGAVGGAWPGGWAAGTSKGHGAAGEGEEEEERGAVGLAGSDFLHQVRLPSQLRALPGSQRPRTAAFLGQPPR